MHRFARLIAAITLVVAASAGMARAQDSAAMTVGGTTITFDGGLQYLSLPDIITGVASSGSFHANLPTTAAASAAPSTPRLAFGTAIA
jgi:hypothetical protein